MDDLVKNSMNILEPSPVDATGNDREDVLSSSSPVDLLSLPGWVLPICNWIDPNS
ncbi:unnamed protein product [Miscanthus lutarioriparius]|uniref:Uncharacterized protein n=1 Tax=Miscanthus lutarioriparius TaxID=422564 RepID=A0A811Q0G4_9POAL|nr:unnamed protein product [Miscanthus lutarioriparius]